MMDPSRSARGRSDAGYADWPHVALFVETTMSYGRRILLGVSE